MLSTPAQGSFNEGAASSLAKVFLQMFERRLGVVPPELARRIQLAPLPELEAWLDRIADGETLEEVFGLPTR